MMLFNKYKVIFFFVFYLNPIVKRYHILNTYLIKKKCKYAFRKKKNRR